jgi:hypothetical protein
VKAKGCWVTVSGTDPVQMEKKALKFAEKFFGEGYELEAGLWDAEVDYFIEARDGGEISVGLWSGRIYVTATEKRSGGIRVKPHPR